MRKCYDVYKAKDVIRHIAQSKATTIIYSTNYMHPMFTYYCKFGLATMLAFHLGFSI